LISSLFNDAISPAKVESTGKMIVSYDIIGGCRIFCLRSEFVYKKRGKSRKTKIIQQAGKSQIGIRGEMIRSRDFRCSSYTV
jgi:hypothetical protein